MTIVAALLPTILSVILAVSSSEEGGRTLFVEPALRPHFFQADELGHRPCPDFISKPYVEFSIKRTQIVQMLWFQNIGLYSAVIFLYVDPRGSLAQIATFLIVCFAFSLLLYRAVVERDVFYWWRRLSVRLATIVFVGAWIFAARTRPVSLDVFGYALHPEKVLSLLGASVAGYYPILAGLVGVVLFFVMSAISTHETPSSRRQIMDELDRNPQGHSYDEWVKILDKKRHRTQWTRLGLLFKKAIGARSFEEEVRTQLEKQVYRGEMNVRLSQFGSLAQAIFYRYESKAPAKPAGNISQLL